MHQAIPRFQRPSTIRLIPRSVANASLNHATTVTVTDLALTIMQLLPTEQHRLAQIVNSDRVILFYKNSPDKEHPEVLWSVYGATDTNEIIVCARRGSLAFFHSGPSPLIWPAMGDRIYGIDVSDEATAQKLGIELWNMAGPHLCKA